MKVIVKPPSFARMLPNKPLRRILNPTNRILAYNSDMFSLGVPLVTHACCDGELKHLIDALEADRSFGISHARSDHFVTQFTGPH